MTTFEQLEHLKNTLHNFHSAGNNQYYANCPTHDDKHDSLSIKIGNTEKLILTCHAGCSWKDILKATGLWRDLTNNNHLTIEQLAEHKALPVNFLKESMGLIQLKDGVEIPYFNENKTKAPRSRKRTNLVAKEGSYWLGSSEESIVSYGLQFLDEAIEQGYLFINEGESDTWTFIHHNRPSLGTPGIELVNKTIIPQYLEKISKLYCIQEPDNSGTKFIENLRNRFEVIGYEGQAFAVKLPTKDVNDLHKLCLEEGKSFDEEIQKAIEQSTLFFEQPNNNTQEKDYHQTETTNSMFKLLTIDDMLSLSDPEFLIDNFLPMNSLAVIYGQPGVGKSFVTLDMALSVASGKDWQGNTTKAGNVVYIAAEAPTGMGKRLDSWIQYNKPTKKPNLNFIAQSLDLLNSNHVDQLINATQQLKPKLIILDTLNRCFIGDENNSKDMAIAMNSCDKIRRITGATVLLVHHTCKNQDIERGHSSLRGTADTMIKLTRKNNSNILTLDVDKQRDSKEETIQLDLKEHANSCIITNHYQQTNKTKTTSPQDNYKKTILTNLLKHGRTQTTFLRQQTQIRKNTFHEKLTELVKEELIAKHELGKIVEYEITKKGENYIKLV
jgi:hypothetical protein